MRRCLLPRLLIAMSLSCAAACAHADLTLLVGDSPPFNELSKGHPQGISVDVVEALMQRAGVARHYEEMPWPRALRYVLQTPQSCLYTVARVPAREAQFHWIGPVGRNQWALFALRERHITLRDLDDARAYRLGGLHTDGKSAFLLDRGFSLDMTTTEELGMRMLYAGRVDITAGALLSAPLIARKLGLDAQRLQPLLVYHSVDTYLACNLQTDPATVQALQKTFRAMNDDGSLRRLQEQGQARLEDRAPAPRR